MIEIRELVIKATVENSGKNNSEVTTDNRNSERDERKGCCSETVDMILQIINDKKER